MHRPSKRAINANVVAGRLSDSVSVEVGRRIGIRGRQALLLLLDALCYAGDLDCDTWEFAVRKSALKKAGLNSNDIRWLIGKGYLQHKIETTATNARVRRFRSERSHHFVKRSSFVLTKTGLGFVQLLLSETKLVNPARQSRSQQDEVDNTWAHSAGIALPQWDSDRQELRLGEVVIKRFKVPARNQETVLTVFQEEGWPVRIDDPLPQMIDMNPKRRLHDTINALNRNQKAQLIRFRGDGQAQGVRWEFVMKPRLPHRRRHTA